MRIVKDYFGEHYSYISEDRAKRPIELKSPEASQEVDPKHCPFCPGNEQLTPAEIGRVPDEKGGWKMRWFSNKFPAVSSDQKKAYGYHEVIVETPDPQKQLWDFSDTELVEVLKVYQERIRELQKDPKIAYVAVFKNHGFESGATIWHSHTQVIATSVFPSRRERKLQRSAQLNVCPYCEIINKFVSPEVEIKECRNRATAQKLHSLKVLENEDFLVVCPKAPRFAMEVWIVSKEHGGDFVFFSDGKLFFLAQALEKILKKLRQLNASYCFYLERGVKESNANDSHFRLEVLPRLHKWGGFELASGDYIIGVPPEAAAEFFRT